ncbi:MAG: ATP-binding cassette domain-containing protein [Myxococcota bacterium]
MAAEARPASEPLLSVHDLRTWFPIKKGLFQKTVGHVKAVDGVSFDVQAGRTLALVGESGSGKTTVGRTLMRLIPAHDGRVTFDGDDWFSLTDDRLRSSRRKMQMIFQDPMTSLNPRMRVEQLVGEGIEAFRLAPDARARRDRVVEVLERVGLGTDHLARFPHEFSGGQRQRLGIARALAVEPSLLICDEAVSALDVSIQAQILNLLSDLQQDLGIAYIFITHDMGVVKHLADDVAVMYSGEIVECNEARALFDAPTHPYTQRLLSSVPTID